MVRSGSFWNTKGRCLRLLTILSPATSSSIMMVSGSCTVGVGSSPRLGAALGRWNLPTVQRLNIFKGSSLPFWGRIQCCGLVELEEEDGFGCILNRTLPSGSRLILN